MVKFFRKIRLKLINAGNLRKYLLYGIGEVLLVVIGILIAFQINEWNGNRKLLIKEKEHVTNLSNEISQSLIRLEEAIEYQEMTLVHIENIVNHITNDLPYSSSLDTSFFVYQFPFAPQFSFTTYETIKTFGINSINPVALRIALTKLYEEQFNFVSQSLNETERSFYQNITTPIHIKRFREKSYLGISEPNNYNNLKTDQEYVNMLYKLKGLRIFSTNTLRTTRDKTSNLLDMLLHRLKVLEKNNK